MAHWLFALALISEHYDYDGDIKVTTTEEYSDSIS